MIFGDSGCVTRLDLKGLSAVLAGSFPGEVMERARRKGHGTTGVVYEYNSPECKQLDFSDTAKRGGSLLCKV